MTDSKTESTSTTIEVVSEEIETSIIRAFSALSSQQIQSNDLTRNIIQKLSEISV